MKMSVPLVPLAALLVLCCQPEDQRTETLDPRGEATRAGLAPEVVAQLDSGSDAYRADDFESALEHYRRAADLAPQEAAGWFGVYMAQHAMGELEAADSALEKAQSLQPGASLIHPTDADTVPPEAPEEDQ